MKRKADTTIDLAPFAIRTQAEVGKILHLSKFAVGRCERRALSKLQRALKKLNTYAARVS